MPLNLPRLLVKAYDCQKREQSMLISPTLMLRILDRINELENEAIAEKQESTTHHDAREQRQDNPNY